MSVHAYSTYVIGVLAAAFLSLATPCGAQGSRGVWTSDSLPLEAPRVVSITPGARYRAGWLHRAMLGSDYRSLWGSEIEVPYLDLRAEAGGLQPTAVGGSRQTTSLRFSGADGREYVFRPLEKDFTRSFPAELRQSLVGGVAQDQVSGYHPAAALVVSRLLDATTIRHPRPRLVVMPDDSSLGEFRRDFAGVLGQFEERPARGFDATSETRGAREVVSSEKLFALIRKSADNRVDARTYLAARLVDILVGDRDRHRDQWRWGRFTKGKDAPWEPIPRDRDMSFARFEGVGPGLVRSFVPQLITFNDDFPDMTWLNFNAREIDRRLLVGLERPVWDSVATALQRALTDDVLRAGVRAMPAPFVHVDGDRLFAALRVRRDRLGEAARAYHDVLAREVAFAGTDGADGVRVERAEDGSVTVSVTSVLASKNGGPGVATEWLRRRFLPDETHEVRLFLHGGDDRVTLVGSPTGRILVRVIGGVGNDIVDDSIVGGDAALAVYDSEGVDHVVSERAIRIDRRPWMPRDSARAEDEPRDWGSWSYVQKGVGVAPGVGALASVSFTRVGYAFRHAPFSSTSTLRLDYSIGEGRPRLTWDARFTRPNSPRTLGVRTMASGIELLRFHGFGNESAGDRSDDAYRVYQNVFRVEPGFTIPVGAGASVTWRAIAQHAETRGDAHTVAGALSPYGVGGFTQFGAGATLLVDRRDHAVAATRGYRVESTVAMYPAIGSVDESFATGEVVVSTYHTASAVITRPTLALRAGGRHAWGAFPMHEGAFIGGATTLRGWELQRFVGRSSAHGSAELRLTMARTQLVVPADVGVLGFGDAGRVFGDDESSGRWHHGMGGGIWLAPVSRAFTVSVSYAHGRERNAVYVSHGFAF